MYMIYIIICMYIYIYIEREREISLARYFLRIWLRTNGVNTNGAAAIVMISDRLRKKGTPWHFWESKSMLTVVRKKSLCQNK